MKNLFLPHGFKMIGFILMVVGISLGLYIMKYHWAPQWLTVSVPAIWSGNVKTNNISDEIAGVLFILGCLFTVFSKETVEDDVITEMRLESFRWAALVYGLIVLFSLIFIYDISFLKIMMYNLFTPFIVYILRFNYLFYSNIIQQNRLRGK